MLFWNFEEKIMKKFYLFVLLVFLSAKMISQTTDVITGLNSPRTLAIYGNDLLVSEPNLKKISRIDESVNPATSTAILTSTVDTPYALFIDGNYLYYSSAANKKIYKMDLSSATPTPIQLTSVSSGVQNIAVNGNSVYLVEGSAGKISVISVFPSNTFYTTLIGGLANPHGLVIKGNILYFAEAASGKISKIDVSSPTPTATTVVNGLQFPDGLVLNGNDLYISENTGVISKIDISVPSPVITPVVSVGSGYPEGLIIKNNVLYIAEKDGNKISKFNLSSLATQENSLNNSIKIYPNPSSDFINISSKSKIIKVELYDPAGKLLSRNTASKIDISHYPKGIYLLKILTVNKEFSREIIKK